jgi:hypothetical protein
VHGLAEARRQTCRKEVREGSGTCEEWLSRRTVDCHHHRKQLNAYTTTHVWLLAHASAASKQAH